MLLGIAGMFAPNAWAGSAHFVSVDGSRSGNTLTVTGKEAGLGNLEQVNITLDATANCINPGGHGPKAANKQSLNSSVDVPVQNGKAIFSLSVTASFSPECSPPMTVTFTNVVVTDTTNGISKNLGNF
ncbi:hypothetical protein [Streptomyces sp. NBC_01481]|uniref:hypothetical protein n=1 Tax=Streptomyces sp. NBC_01481 TaxID=2975869 RepID=UPI0022539BFD|nr:hypothetical protein [Streptomyces sp. NBC_01481]MCX4587618.1 hypothetical protein [Streptomyces sp. NBC_01481]